MQVCDWNFFSPHIIIGEDKEWPSSGGIMSQFVVAAGSEEIKFQNGSLDAASDVYS